MNSTHPSPAAAILLPEIHDARSIQQALSTVIQAVAAGTLDNARARVLLSALKLAFANLRNLSSDDAAQPSPARPEQQPEEANKEQASAGTTVPGTPATAAATSMHPYVFRNNRIPAMPAAPASTHFGAFSPVTPPSA